jgi:phenylacetate-CoA ligase
MRTHWQNDERPNLRGINWLYVNAVLPLLDPAIYTQMGEQMRRCERLEWSSEAEILHRQWDSLLDLLQHAYDSVPFYRKRFDEAGVRPRDICSSSDLAKIPPLTREDLRLHQDELWSRRYQRETLLPAATGGTTDTPAPLLRSPEAIQRRMAVHLRFNSWAGMLPGDKVFYLWGAQSDFSQNPSWRWRLYDRYIMRRVWAPTSLLNQQVLETYRLKLNSFRPRIIYAYPTPLALFCEYLRDCGKPFHRPVSAICTAEPLLAQQREVIGKVLGCPVFELYGSRESGMIAGECEHHQGLHFNPFAAYVEFLPVEGVEGEGLCEMLVTDLLNQGMPLIRYKINDCALISAGTCACGRGYPRVKQITGRTGDIFILPNGDCVPGIALTNRILQVCPGLSKLQVIQDTVEEFRLRFVPGPGFSSADLELLRGNLKKFFPDQLYWKFEQVSDIVRERSGKTRFCISHVSRPSAAPCIGAKTELQ